MLLLAGLSSHLLDTPLFEQMIHGLKLLAIIVVADACLTMYRNFCQQRLTAGLCVLTAVAITLAPGLITQFAVLLIAAFVGQARLAPQQSFSTTTFSPSWLSLLLLQVYYSGCRSWLQAHRWLSCLAISSKQEA